jgi:hypothetical protein
MKTKLVTAEFKHKPPTRFGSPGPTRLLYEWVYKLDLEKYNILVTDPIDVVNFIAKHMIYQRDIVTFGQNEYWLQNADDVYEYIFDKTYDDCDGAAVAVASILYSLNNENIRLALGYCGPNPGENAPLKGTNHAYCLLINPNNLDDPFILDAVGDNIIFELNLSSQLSSYETLISASPFTKETWIHGHWVEKYN